MSGEVPFLDRGGVAGTNDGNFSENGDLMNRGQGLGSLEMSKTE